MKGTGTFVGIEEELFEPTKHARRKAGKERWCGKKVKDIKNGQKTLELSAENTCPVIRDGAIVSLKKKYASIAEAGKYRRFLKNKGKEGLEIYHCHRCHCFHLGHKLGETKGAFEKVKV